MVSKKRSVFYSSGKAPAHMQNSWRWMMQRTCPAAQANIKNSIPLFIRKASYSFITVFNVSHFCSRICRKKGLRAGVPDAALNAFFRNHFCIHAVLFLCHFSHSSYSSLLVEAGIIQFIALIPQKQVVAQNLRVVDLVSNSTIWAPSSSISVPALSAGAHLGTAAALLLAIACLLGLILLLGGSGCLEVSRSCSFWKFW